jgi:hypothetical protein
MTIWTGVIGRQAPWPRRWRRGRRRWRLSLIIIDFLWRFGFAAEPSLILPRIQAPSGVKGPWHEAGVKGPWHKAIDGWEKQKSYICCTWY